MSAGLSNCHVWSGFCRGGVVATCMLMLQSASALTVAANEVPPRVNTARFTSGFSSRSPATTNRVSGGGSAGLMLGSLSSRP